VNDVEDLAPTPDFEGDPSAEPPPSAAPMKMPKELASVPDRELREILRAARAYALTKTKSRVGADMLVSDVLMKLMTTRRWDPTRAPLQKYFLFVIKSEFSNQITSAAPERENSAHEGFHREVRPDHSPSAEDGILDHGEQKERHDQSRIELDALKARIARHPLMPRVLECRGEGMTPGETARLLQVPERDVYAAIKLLKHHLSRIRESDHGGRD
jgi:DNA-directed RNA polymerase specialized sigma24 family protein